MSAVAFDHTGSQLGDGELATKTETIEISRASLQAQIKLVELSQIHSYAIVRPTAVEQNPIKKTSFQIQSKQLKDIPPLYDVELLNVRRKLEQTENLDTVLDPHVLVRGAESQKCSQCYLTPKLETVIYQHVCMLLLCSKPHLSSQTHI